MSEASTAKMNDKSSNQHQPDLKSSNQKQELSRSNSSNGHGEKKKPPHLQHRNSWPTNASSVSPRGPMKSHLAKMKEEVVLTELSDTDGATEVVPCEEGFPDPSRQKEIVTSIDSECTCTYAVAKVWHRKWEEYCGIKVGSPRMSAGAEKPGPLEMDTHNDQNNDYINEDIWKLFVKWYGVSQLHQLDRKHLYFKDEKMFDICILSPFSGIVEHNVKKFNRFEEIGYIECQLRKVFHIPDYKKTRLWISEKAQVPRFRQLILRFRMLNDCIHRDKVYILALEECLGNDTWPTGEPGDPKGELSKYAELMVGPKPDDYWSQEITTSLRTLQAQVTETIKETAEAFLQNGRNLMQEKEAALDTDQKSVDLKMEESVAKEKFLDERAKDLARQEQILKQEMEKVQGEQDEVKRREQKLEEEIKHMESMHRINENKIKLDIGGQIFTTSIQTLQRDKESMLAAMFSGRYELKKESDGSYFIDRDGTFFRYILNFLRDGYIEEGTIPSDPAKVKEVLREAKYYQLTNLVEYLEQILQINHRK